MPSLATFCNNYSLQFNGIISESVNIIELIAETAPFFLLSFISTGGQYRFAPVLPLERQPADQHLDAIACRYVHRG
jgi:hypothetical protein